MVTRTWLFSWIIVLLTGFSVPAYSASTVSGLLDVSYPVWNRTSDRSDGLGGFLDSANNGLPYEVLEVQSPVAGDTLTVTVQGGTQFDSFLALYSSFNPLSPATNILAADDDSAGYPHASLSKAGLAANTSYYLVISSYAASVDPVYLPYGGYQLSLGGSFNVVPQATVTTLSAVPVSITAGQTVTLTATVTKLSGIAAPTGTVTFKEGFAVLGSSSLNGSGQAGLILSSLTVGAHSIVAEYSGETKYGASTSAPVQVDVTPVMRQLSVTLSGTGSGSIASDVNHSGIACPSMCQASYPDGSVVTLSQFPAIASAFSGWSGACAADPCQVTMDGDKGVQASFTLAQVRNTTAALNFATLPEALAAAATNDELLLQGMSYNDAISLDTGVYLNGGWDASFGTRSSVSTLGSGMTVQSGNSRAANIAVKGLLHVTGGSLKAIGVTVSP